MSNLKQSLKEIGLKRHEVEFIESIGMIRHKFYVGFIVTGEVAKMVKTHIDYKRDTARMGMQNRNCYQYVFSHTRPFRLDAFMEYELLNGTDSDSMKMDIAKTLADVWIDCENPHINIDVWKAYFKKYGADSMSTEEIDFLTRLDDNIEIYRGVQSECNDEGISWTLDKDKALWFANRFRGEGIVRVKKISKSAVSCFYNGRGECEIILI